MNYSIVSHTPPTSVDMTGVPHNYASITTRLQGSINVDGANIASKLPKYSSRAFPCMGGLYTKFGTVKYGVGSPLPQMTNVTSGNFLAISTT